MIAPDGAQLLATVCNTTSNAVPYALWLASGDRQFLVDLSDVLGQPGDSGLTGIAHCGERIYVAVQSASAARILILDRRLCPVGVITSPDFADIHSIHAAGDALIVCSTGARSVVRVDIATHRTAILHSFDANVHLNAACFAEDDLLVCCHHASLAFPDVAGGGVINATRRGMMLTGLGQPHSLLSTDGDFLVLDSDAHRVVRFNRYGIQQQQAVSGFPRGLAVRGGRMYIGSSAGRVISRKNPVAAQTPPFWDMAVERVCIHELEATDLQPRATHYPLVAGFEIYDLLALDGAVMVEPPGERLVVPDIHAMARAYYEATKRALAESP